MATVSEVITEILTNDTDYTDIVGTRLYPSVLPPNAVLPATTFNKVSGRGGTTTGPDLVMTRFQFDTYSDSYLEAEQAGNAIYAALRRYSSTVLGRDVADGQMDYRQTVYDGEANTYRDILDIKIWTNGV